MYNPGHTGAFQWPPSIQPRPPALCIMSHLLLVGKAFGRERLADVLASLTKASCLRLLAAPVVLLFEQLLFFGPRSEPKLSWQQKPKQASLLNLEQPLTLLVSLIETGAKSVLAHRASDDYVISGHHPSLCYGWHPGKMAGNTNPVPACSTLCKTGVSSPLISCKTTALLAVAPSSNLVNMVQTPTTCPARRA